MGKLVHSAGLVLLMACTLQVQCHSEPIAPVKPTETAQVEPSWPTPCQARQIFTYGDPAQPPVRKEVDCPPPYPRHFRDYKPDPEAKFRTHFPRRWQSYQALERLERQERSAEELRRSAEELEERLRSPHFPKPLCRSAGAPCDELSPSREWQR